MPQKEPSPPALEQLLAAQNLIIEMIATGTPLDGVLRAVAAFIDQQAQPGLCCIFLLDADGRSLRPAAAGKLPRSFVRALDGTPVGPKGGASGAAAYHRRRITVSDVGADALYEDYRDLARAHGVCSSWSTPIHSSEGGILGTVSLYYGERHVPARHQIAAVEAAVYLARIAIERCRMEERLQSDTEQFRSLIENTSDVISILDADGVICYLSPSVERILGFRPHELVGTSGFDCFHPHDVARARRAFQLALQQPGACQPIEQRFRHRDGSWRVLDTIANNQLGDPRIAGVIVTGHDITPRKRAEDELISSQGRYHELFENANDVIFTHDLAGILTSLNKAGERLLGYSRDELLGTKISQFIAPECRGKDREMLDRKIGGEAQTTYELELIGKQGARISVEVSTRLIFEMGRPIGVQGIARDITERRRFDARLRQAQKMEAIGRLAGGVAHDFNNLLSVITGYGQWILEEVAPDSPLAEHISEILVAANRGSILTNQLLAVARNQVIQPIIIDLSALVAELDQMLRRIIGEDIELIAAMSPDLGLVRADPGQIEQVILNLVINARDAMPHGGQLFLETANVEVGEQEAQTRLDYPPGAYVILTVADSGHGIDERIRPHIFEPFFTTKEAGKGTGLGLATVYGIIKQIGGHITVDSEPGAGTVFRIYLPRVAGDVVASPPAQRQARGGRGEIILLVEDEAAVRRTVASMLLRLGYIAVEAPSGQAAQTIVNDRDKPIHVLLTDVVMPELSGWELARKLRAVRTEMKVLYMSGYAGEAMALEGDLEPGTAFLKKPFTMDALAGKLRELLDG